MTYILSDLALKNDFETLYEDADRHGVKEWMYRQPNGDFSLFISIAAWTSSPDYVTCESFAGISNTVGYTRQAVYRTTIRADFFDTWDTAAALFNPALVRVEILHDRAQAAAASGETAVERTFVARRPM